MKLVIKLSGKVLADTRLMRSVCQQISHLHGAGHLIAVVHGGGRQLSEFCRERSISVVQVQGRRVTDLPTLEAARMVFSSINRSLTACLISFQVNSVGISGFDGRLTTSHRRLPVPMEVNGNTQLVDFGFVGDITRVDPSLIHCLWNTGIVPVISSLSADEDGQILNVNADTLSSEISAALDTDRLISVSDVEGIYLDPKEPSTRISSIDLETAKGYLAEGIFLDGMLPKVQGAINALEKGVRSFQILSGLNDGALSSCISKNPGTVVSR